MRRSFRCRWRGSSQSIGVRFSWRLSINIRRRLLNLALSSSFSTPKKLASLLSAIAARTGVFSRPLAVRDRVWARLSLGLSERATRLLSNKDRKSVVEGKSVSVRVVLGGGRIIKKKTIPQKQ